MNETLKRADRIMSTIWAETKDLMVDLWPLWFGLSLSYSAWVVLS